MPLCKTFLPAALIAVLFGAPFVAVAESPVSLLQPNTVNAFNERICVGSSDRELCARVQLSLDMVAVDWLDQKLLKQLALNPEDQRLQSAVGIDEHLAVLASQGRESLELHRADLQTALEDDSFLTSDVLTRINYLWQRGALASFMVNHYSYGGGAHGMSFLEYKQLDLHSKRWLQPEDIIQHGREQELLELLLQAYGEQKPELVDSWLADTPESRALQLLTDNILLNQHGLLFSYGPYALGPYSEGQIELQLFWHQLENVLQPRWMQ